MLSPIYACLLVVITSLNALGSCHVRSYAKLGGLYLNWNIKQLNPLGNKGIMSNQIIQPVSPDALSASSISSDSETSSLTRSTLSIENTPSGGSMLGTVRPYWRKVLESEQRICWLKSMVSKSLVVRDLESYARKIGSKLRSEEYKLREEEREIILGIMRLKLKDEKKHLLALYRRKDEKKKWLTEQLGKGRRLDTILSRLRKEMLRLKPKLKKKYRDKLEHLEAERQKELDTKKCIIVIPDELVDFKDCILYNKTKRDNLH